jgi:hypothetical protein
VSLFIFMPEILRPIYIEKEEGVGSVLSRIQKTSEKRLALVFPPGSLIFKNVLEVEFLKREIDKLGKQAVVITSDQSQAELAKGLGFSSGTDIQKDEKTEDFLTDFYTNDQSSSRRSQSQPKISDIVSNETTKVSIDKTGSTMPKKELQREEPLKEPVPDEPKEENVLKVKPIALEDEALEEQITEDANPSSKKKARRKISFGIFKQPSFKKLASNPFKKLFVFFLLAAVGVFFLTATFIFPRANITVSPARDKVQIKIDVLFDSEVKAVDFEKNIVPGQIFKITKTASNNFTATQEQDINKKATGIITIYNAYSSAPQTLVKTTRFRSSDGKVFRITKTITVPGAEIEGGSIKPSSIDAEVIADQPGESYNIGSTDFTIPGFKGSDKYDGFYGKSTQKMTGGLVSHGLVVSEADVEKAKESLEKQLLEQAKQDLKKQLDEDFELLEASLQAEIIKSTPEPAIGDPAQNFKLILEALAQGFAYKSDHLESLIEDKIALKISDKRLTLPETQAITYQSPNIDYTENQAAFNLLIEEDVSWKIAEDRLKEVLSGKNKPEAREAIKLFSEIESARFSLWPYWISRIPKDPRQIYLTVDY